ncbi:MAG: hypothetical protein BAJALOKI2v1_50051 [Promethearchaeota archaeon]|nr:MAG: hypothetical protein BAJALOKI2v1_50051 [Candidatus Lokiarchaeota archaeon]
MLETITLNKYCLIARETTSRTNRLNSLMIKNREQKVELMIDANYPFRFIDKLYSILEFSPKKKLIFSHCHLDHTGHAFYHQKKFGTPLYCPIQEKEYLISLNSFMKKVGFKRLGLEENYRNFAKERVKFKECKNVQTFQPGIDSFDLDSVKIETIHIPGHSPGQTAFIINSKNLNGYYNRNEPSKVNKLMYVADIGSHPYYGDLNSNLEEYRASIDKLESIYLSDQYILVPAHGKFYFGQEGEFFDRIRDNLNNNEQKVKQALKKNQTKTIKNLVEENIITPKRRKHEIIKDLYLLWEGGKIYHHLNELIEKGVVQKQKGKDLLSDKYKLN